MEFMLSRPERTLRGYEMAKELLLFSHPGRPAGPTAWISPETMEFTWKPVKSTISQELCEIPMESIILLFPHLAAHLRKPYVILANSMPFGAPIHSKSRVLVKSVESGDSRALFGEIT